MAEWRRALTVADQVSTPGSNLLSFLDEALPQRHLVADEWRQMLAHAPTAGIAIDGYRSHVGKAFEMRLGLDLASRPVYWRWLAFLPPSQCDALLRTAGFETPIGRRDDLAADPMLQMWTRADRPTGDDAVQRQALSALFAVVHWADLVHDPNQRF